MLIKITTQCSMGCSHCMEDALPYGEHMSMEVFIKSLKFIERTYRSLKMILLSGGEPLEHPQIFDFLELLHGWKTVLMSNGLFLKNDTLREKVLSYDISVQVYNDPRYYPIKVDVFEYPKIIFGTSINKMSPFGRAVTNKLAAERMSPLCYNLRSCARTLKDFSESVLALRMSGKMCSPSINVLGDVLAGESRFCHKIGTIESSEEELLQKLLTMECNKCGLEDNLPSMLKTIIHKGT